MTPKHLQKLIATNCDKIVDILNDIQDAVDEYGDEEIYDVTISWIETIKQCIGEEINTDVDKTATDTLELLK